MDTGNAKCGAAHRGLRIAGGALGGLLASTASAQAPREKSVDGIVVRIGVVPIEQVQALGGARPERTMHMNHSASDREHLVVSLSEERTGKPIERADVRATVSRLGMGEEHRSLELMRQPGFTTWGGYFDLREPGRYMIRVEVVRPGQPGPAVAQFAYANR